MSRDSKDTHKNTHDTLRLHGFQTWLAGQSTKSKQGRWDKSLGSLGELPMASHGILFHGALRGFAAKVLLGSRNDGEINSPLTEAGNGTPPEEMELQIWGKIHLTPNDFELNNGV